MGFPRAPLLVVVDDDDDDDDAAVSRGRSALDSSIEPGEGLCLCSSLFCCCPCCGEAYCCLASARTGGTATQLILCGRAGRCRVYSDLSQWLVVRSTVSSITVIIREEAEAVPLRLLSFSPVLPDDATILASTNACRPCICLRSVESLCSTTSALLAPWFSPPPPPSSSSRFLLVAVASRMTANASSSASKEFANLSCSTLKI
mmetsp:Transcript_5514/g.8523  ORF Transcript_5514/g.8523 Transcript_5514/m.8523 type:complete len:203 (+) Transcript_5514:1212-1820(+)